jgi:[ribosomal protein S5]-alanine N-acetyltransferase
MINQNKLSVREINESDFENIIDYFLNADKNFLLAMGVDESKLPERQEWLKLLSDEFELPVKKKKLYYIIWLLNDEPLGHSNINKIIFGEEAYMHLHMWHPEKRQKGIGLEFMKMSLRLYFDKFELKKLFCEPYAKNPAPNKTLERLGFDFIEQHDTTPGWLNFFQTVNRWDMDLNKYKTLYG